MIDYGGRGCWCQWILSDQQSLHRLFFLFETVGIHEFNQTSAIQTAELFVFILCKIMFLFLTLPLLKPFFFYKWLNMPIVNMQTNVCIPLLFSSYEPAAGFSSTHIKFNSSVYSLLKLMLRKWNCSSFFSLLVWVNIQEKVKVQIQLSLFSFVLQQSQ